MIDKERINKILQNEIDLNNLVVIDIQVNHANSIKVTIDSMAGVSIDECANISKLIENQLDRDVEDFELEVSSYGISQPFIMPLHYHKNLNKLIEVYMKEGKAYKGILKSVELTDDKKEVKHIDILVNQKVKPEGKKRKIEVEEIVKLMYSDIQKAKLLHVF
jgi:ribosome maturation factor RimP